MQFVTEPFLWYYLCVCHKQHPLRSVLTNQVLHVLGLLFAYVNLVVCKSWIDR